MRHNTTLQELRGFDFAKPVDPQQLLNRLEEKERNTALELAILGSSVSLVLGVLIGLVLSKFIG